MRYLSILTFLFSIAVINPAHAGVLLEFDLSVTNQLTITATTGTALARLTGDTGTGIVLEGTGELIGDSLGDAPHTFGFATSDGVMQRVKLNHLNDPAGNNSINLFEETFSDSVPIDINQGQQVFVGTTTHHLESSEYESFRDAPNSGKIYAFADNNLYATAAGSVYIGDWAKASSGTVPEPSTAIAMGLLGVLGFAGNRRRRRQVSAA